MCLLVVEDCKRLQVCFGSAGPRRMHHAAETIRTAIRRFGGASEPLKHDDGPDVLPAHLPAGVGPRMVVVKMCVSWSATRECKTSHSSMLLTCT